ncbi:MAG: carboxypeptidase-like regulatory domain-containing protein [Planctomycetaceae bacterium]|jgi:hypothetical protein|nr:carboxypeptidase-like regulatory domain-containing protein [Planctomycetaceae bacterium]
MKKIHVILILFLFLFVVGCSGGSFRVEVVEGTVTLDGIPLEGATLTFIPSDSNIGKSAYARTDMQGTFKLTAVQGGTSGAGTMVGHYRVAISKDVPSREPTAKEITDQERGISPDIPILHIIPEKYNDAQTSGLTAEVVKGKNIFNFDLKSNNQ